MEKVYLLSIFMLVCVFLSEFFPCFITKIISATKKIKKTLKYKEHTHELVKSECLRSLKFVEQPEFDQLIPFIAGDRYIAFDKEKPEQRYVSFIVKDGKFNFNLYIEFEEQGVSKETKEAAIDFLSKFEEITLDYDSGKYKADILTIVMRHEYIEVHYVPVLFNSSWIIYYSRDENKNWNWSF